MKPCASVSLDLDNKWSYLKTHGDAEWESYPTYIDSLLPRVLDLLAARDLRMTFFIVGQDAALPVNHEALRMITETGNEVGNHSFKHEPWLHRYSPSEVRDEIRRAQDVIEEVTGQRPRGFRGPGYSLTKEVLVTLNELDYQYDCSTFPTYIGPVARAYYFMTAELSKEDKEDRDELFGSMRDGLRPLKPYMWDLGNAKLLEVPVTTMPVVKSPFHVSYLLYLSGFSPVAAKTYFQVALTACRRAGIEPSLLFHPLDFLGGDEVDGLDFFPAMNLPGGLKRERVSEYLEELREHFDVVPLGVHVERILQRGELPVRPPKFDT